MPTICTIAVVCLSVLVLLTACTSVKDRSPEELPETVANPKQILVFDYAVSSEEMQPGKAMDDRLKRLLPGTFPRSEAERALGKTMAHALSRHLVEAIGALGIPAVRATTNSIVNSETLLVKGQLFSVEEDNHRQHAVIGLEMGRTQVRALTQFYGVVHGNEILLNDFDLDAVNEHKKGATNPPGTDMAAGWLTASAVIHSGVAVGSDAFTDSVEMDATRAAGIIAEQLKKVYLTHGWIKDKDQPRQH